MSESYAMPADARADLLEAMSKDAFSILPEDFASAIRESASQLALTGRGNVWDNGLPLDYPTLLGLAVRFADSDAVRESVRLERVQRNRHNFLYRR